MNPQCFLILLLDFHAVVIIIRFITFPLFESGANKSTSAVPSLQKSKIPLAYTTTILYRAKIDISA